jgi:hypothetical protein
MSMETNVRGLKDQGRRRGEVGHHEETVWAPFDRGLYQPENWLAKDHVGLHKRRHARTELGDEPADKEAVIAQGDHWLGGQTTDHSPPFNTRPLESSAPESQPYLDLTLSRYIYMVVHQQLYHKMVFLSMIHANFQEAP